VRWYDTDGETRATPGEPEGLAFRLDRDPNRKESRSSATSKLVVEYYAR